MMLLFLDLEEASGLTLGWMHMCSLDPRTALSKNSDEDDARM